MMMNNLVPFRNQRRGRDLDTLFERFFNDPIFGDHRMAPAMQSGIKVDIQEESDKYLMEAEIPGFEKDQIKIDYDNEHLIISAEKEDEVNEERENYICRERKMGRVSRTFLVKDINPDKIEAKYENGILKVELPKDPQKETRKQIEIK